jgi:hypothetical protein
VTWTARDDADHASTAAQTVDVIDTRPPTITCPDAITAECTGGGSATVTPGVARAFDDCGADVTTHARASFPVGTTPLTYVATDRAGSTASCTSDVTVVDTTPPTMTCPAPAVIECTANHGAPFAPAPASASDACAGVTIADPPGGIFPSGTTSFTYSATDEAGLTATCATSVTVADTTPPSITGLTATPSELWPPNHKMVPVTLGVTASDRCDPAAPVCRITAITSNEPVNDLGDGNTAPDWQITGPREALLRSERSGRTRKGPPPTSAVPDGSTRWR